MMTVDNIIEIYYNNLKDFDYYSDPQKVFYIDGIIYVNLRGDYGYRTKEKIETPEQAIAALFEIERLSEDDEYWNDPQLYSKFWERDC